MAINTARLPPPFSPLPHSSMRPDLPLEIFYLIRDHLRRERMMGTAAALLPVSQSFHRLFSPIIDYTTLILRANNVEKVLRFTRHIPIGDQFTELYLHRSTRHQVNPQKSAPVLRPSKLKLLDTCVNLTIDDHRSLEHLLKTSRSAWEWKLFRTISHLSLGPDLMAHFGFSINPYLRPSILDLGSIIEPNNLCVTYPSPDTVAEFEQQRWGRDPNVVVPWTEERWQRHYDETWAYRLNQGISDLICDLAGRWDLRSITIHNLKGQSLPLYRRCPSLRVFYARKGQGSVAKDEGVCLMRSRELEQSRLRAIHDVVLCAGFDTYDFIGAATWRPGARNSGRSAVEVPTTCLRDIRDEMDEKGENTEGEVEELFWEKPPYKVVRDEPGPGIHFVSLREAVACECCGGK